MGKLTDGEAIVKLQTQMEQVQTDLTVVRHDTGQILEKLLTLPQQYITREEFDKRLKILMRRNVIQHAVSAGVGIIFGGVITAMAYALFVGRVH